MKIGVYNEPGGTGVGGSETLVALLAERLARENSVDIIHHISGLTEERLASISGADLTSVGLRFVERDGDRHLYVRNLLTRYRAARNWHATLSEPYDVFVATVHGFPPFCRARRGALIILFPWETAPHLSPTPLEFSRKSLLKRQAVHHYHRFEWHRRFEGYQVVTAISDFSRRWTTRRWQIESEIAYPPVDTNFNVVPKENIILSVGRFALEGEGHRKNQPQMLAAYRAIEPRLPHWEYQTVGGLRNTKEHHAFLTSLKEEAAMCRAAYVKADLPREDLRSLYERASIFWHATGLGENEENHPEMAEHFGISTVEAMAAGCVPVVINKGGQAEIVRHGVDGFLWNTVEELKSYTLSLTVDDALRARMSKSARERAAHFSKEASLRRYAELLSPLLC